MNALTIENSTQGTYYVRENGEALVGSFGTVAEAEAFVTANTDEPKKITKAPVPFITRWAGEDRDNSLPLQFDRNGLTGLPRDPRGVTWSPAGTDRSGEPQFAQVHPGRQREAMTSPLCQVCGVHLTQKWVPWLINVTRSDFAEALASLRTIPYVSDPPTCTECQELARRHCPAVRSHAGGISIEVRHWRPVGVTGDLYRMTTDGPVLHGGVPIIRFGDPHISWVLAKQLVVEIDRYRLA
jgi:hypothetical protein